MLIARFGATWAGAYEFPTLKAVDDWSTIRPPVTVRVSGASGEFDYYADDNYPVNPLDVSKTFTLEGNSYSNVETLLNTLRADLIAEGRSKLWGLWRDGSTHVWTWAKCVSLKAVETSREKTSVLMTVQVKFRCSVGFWYGETEQTNTFSVLSAGANVNDRTLVNSGNQDALVKFEVVVNLGTGMSQNVAHNQTTGDNGWVWAGALLLAETLTVDAQLYAVDIDGADEYDNLTLTYGTQIAWLWIQPGSNTVRITTTQGGVPSSVTVTLSWWDTYVL